MGRFTFSQWILDVYNLLLTFTRAHSQAFYLQFQVIFWTWTSGQRLWDPWRWTKFVLYCEMDVSFGGVGLKCYGWDVKCLPKVPELRPEFANVK